ncbi:MAG TPA: hypothetical protein PK625_11630, partial [Spirochaetales bacterium]|nr:hypothetical protein [Spirochaetales bacterium]
NLKGSFGLFFSQRLLLALVDSGMDRQAAYEMVQRVAMRCWEERLQFPDQARKDADIAARLDAAALDAVFDPRAYLAHEDLIYRRVFGEA